MYLHLNNFYMKNILYKTIFFHIQSYFSIPEPAKEQDPGF